MIEPHEQQAPRQSYLSDSVPRARPAIRAFEASVHSVWLHELWNKAMHSRWSITEEALQSVLAAAKLVLIAEQDDISLGIGAVDYDSLGEAALIFLIVDPVWQRQGVGTFILEALEGHLKSEQMSVFRLGAVTTAEYLWPGLPREMDAAWPFFAQTGWRLEEDCYDLIQELNGFETPSWLVKSLETAGATLNLSSPELRTTVAAFEAAHFPVWASYFQQDHASVEDDSHILIAINSKGEVVGTLLLDSNIAQRWSLDRDVRVGSINALGVAIEVRRQGVGLALAARAMALLQERGCTKCYIQWTGLAAWYGRLGATVWAQYRMAIRCL